MYNQIANYVYTQSEINIKIKDQAPKEYMAQVKEQCTGVNAVCGGIDSFLWQQLWQHLFQTVGDGML